MEGRFCRTAMPVAEDVTDVGLLTVVPGKEYAKRLVMAEPDDC